ncbi:MAG TPA: hypothetical protein VFM18_17865 [Methanosarcina sp.]|nr:hypothetical protein [Methanosarcina sp.]
MICYIVKTKKGFKPVVSNIYESEGDNDSFLQDIGTMEVQTDLAEAQRLITEHAPPDSIVYLNPVRFSDPQMKWLSEILKENDGR